MKKLLVILAAFSSIGAARADTIIYGCSKARTIVKINLTTLTATNVGTTSFGTNACEVSADGATMYYWKDQADGANQLRLKTLPNGGEVGRPTQPTAIIKQMAFHGGVLYATRWAGPGDYRRVTIDPASGAVSEAGTWAGVEVYSGAQISGDLVSTPSGLDMLTFQSGLHCDYSSGACSHFFGPDAWAPAVEASTGASYADGYYWASITKDSQNNGRTLRRIDPVTFAIFDAMDGTLPTSLNDLTGAVVQ